MPKQTITIIVQRGRKPPEEMQIEATVKGQLAYYPSVTWMDYYTIGHVKSGRSIMPYVAKRHIHKAMKALAAIDWDAYVETQQMDDTSREIWGDCWNKYG